MSKIVSIVVLVMNVSIMIINIEGHSSFLVCMGIS